MHFRHTPQIQRAASALPGTAPRRIAAARTRVTLLRAGKWMFVFAPL